MRGPVMADEDSDEEIMTLDKGVMKMMRITCPACQTKLEVTDQPPFSVNCPSCSTKLDIA